jgi:hypothetical protein
MTNVEKRITILNDEYKVIFIAGNVKFSKKLADDYGYSNWDSSMLYGKRGLTIYKKGFFPMIFMPKIPTKSDEYATLAHEAVHAIDYLFDSIGDDNRSELFAHCVGAVVRGVLSIKKRK